MTHVDYYAWVILPIIVFDVRVSDVTLGTLSMIFTTIIRRKDLICARDVIKRTHSDAFVSVEEVRSAARGVFSSHSRRQFFSDVGDK